MKSVVVRIDGGLGNQLFQYALGRRIASDAGVKLLLDTRAFASARRPYVLDQFGIRHDGYVTDSPFALRFLTSLNPARRRAASFLLPTVAFRQERAHEFFGLQPDVLTPPSRTLYYLDGYWQHEGYFKPIRHQLTRELRLLNTSNPAFIRLRRHIESTDSIGVHFRCGEDQLTKPIYGLPPMQYFRNAILQLSRSTDAHVFVFSDNIDWVRQRFTADVPVTFVSGSYPVTDQEEFELLRSCKNIVCANSTFSWWAAWLNGGERGRIIAPERWYNDEALEQQTRRGGLIPTSWTRM